MTTYRDLTPREEWDINLYAGVGYSTLVEKYPNIDQSKYDIRLLYFAERIRTEEREKTADEIITAIEKFDFGDPYYLSTNYEIWVEKLKSKYLSGKP